MDDASIIALYWKRDEAAIRETDRRYGQLCYRLAENILKRREDAEECVSDTYLKVWNSIPDDRPEHFSAYLCQIAKRIALSRYRYNTADKRNSGGSLPFEELADVASAQDTPEDTADTAALSEAIRRFLLKESRQNRLLFIRRYWFYDSAEDLSRTFHLSTNAVWSALSRMRKRLKKYLQKEGFSL